MKADIIKSIKGFRDILPDEAKRRRRILEAARATLESYGYGEVELPYLEKVELFARAVGASSDIVEKEMYAFADRDRDSTVIALRPEGTASLVRAYIENGLTRSTPVAKLFYTGPMFRRERPQKGRYRQFHQIGAEFLGRDDPAADAETVTAVADICDAVGVRGAEIQLNSLGDAACRPAYRAKLADYARERFESLCGDCRVRLEKNPFRLLDCKNEGCAAAMIDAPLMLDHLCEACHRHHGETVDLLAAAGVAITIKPRMVRGLDYYCRTAFEITASGLGAQDAVGGGGRYDGLVESLGGPSVPGIGFAFGLERLELAAETPIGSDEQLDSLAVFLAVVGSDAAAACAPLARGLRRAGLRVETDPPERRLKAQMKRADKSGARWVVVVGEDEIAAGRATVRDLQTRTDYPALFAFDDDPAKIRKILMDRGQAAGQ
jgi:histidyl-tRNA synthetase